MDEAEFKRRTRQLGVQCIELCRELPKDPATGVITTQLVKASTSVGANYRASCRGRSVNEIVAKLSTVEEEADETAYWLEVLADCGLVSMERVLPLHREAGEIVAMVVASKRTLKRRAGIRGFGESAGTPLPNRESRIVNREP